MNTPTDDAAVQGALVRLRDKIVAEVPVCGAGECYMSLTPAEWGHVLQFVSEGIDVFAGIEAETKADGRAR